MAELGETGRAIWDAFQAESLDGATQTLIRELARTADTLDRLDRLVRGEREAWISLVFDDMGEIHLQIDKLLDQRAKQQGIYKQLWAELRGWGVKPQSKEGSVGQPVVDEEPEDMLTKRRREREERERKLG